MAEEGEDVEQEGEEEEDDEEAGSKAETRWGREYSGPPTDAAGSSSAGFVEWTLPVSKTFIHFVLPSSMYTPASEKTAKTA